MFFWEYGTSGNTSEWVICIQKELEMRKALFRSFMTIFSLITYEVSKLFYYQKKYQESLQ